MFRKLGLLIVTIGLVFPVAAADKPGSISGYVHSANGVPQMGALVEVLGSAARTRLDYCRGITTSEFLHHLFYLPSAIA